MFPSFELFGITIQTYFLAAIVGLLFAIGLALLRSRAARFHVSAEEVVFAILISMIGGLIGSKIFQLIGHIFRDGGDPNFWTLENWKGLMMGVGVLYGGLIGGVTAALIYIRKSKLDFFEVADILVPSILLFFTFGRIGCFFAGCCYGRVADWGIVLSSHGYEPLIPVQLFEAGFTLIVMAVMLIIRPERKHPGALLPLYLMTYAIGRFVLEFFRGDIGRGVYILSTSQWISLLALPAGIALLMWVNKQQVKRSPQHGLT
jgi:phosphatidylglycerol:prolipoprotein diacylglycerol transferase